MFRRNVTVQTQNPVKFCRTINLVTDTRTTCTLRSDTLFPKARVNDCKHSCPSLRAATQRSSKKGTPPNLTVRRSFTVRNTGQLPLYVHGFSINGLECEGYGFRVLDCAGFHMLPNDTKKIDIA